MGTFTRIEKKLKEALELNDQMRRLASKGGLRGKSIITKEDLKQLDERLLNLMYQHNDNICEIKDLREWIRRKLE